MKKLLHVVGARPNFMKAAPVIDALGESNHFDQLLVHTGQHYDANMSAVFFDELCVPMPDINLEVGSGSHAWQTGRIMTAFEKVVESRRPDLVLVYGDVNSTAAASLVSAKLLVPVAHVEAGLRSFDRTMPEEINRLVTDQLSDLLFAPSLDGVTNLRREGIPEEKIHLVGNVMIDTLVRLLPKASENWETPFFDRWRGREFVLVTLHRPSNVDGKEMLSGIVKALRKIARECCVVFPAHPRTRRRLEELDLGGGSGCLEVIEPLGYLDFLTLQRCAKLIITDSGGIQEEATYLKVPCLTVRENTERPVTIEIGTNTLVGQDMGLLWSRVQTILKGEPCQGQIPPLWDGKTAKRVAEVIERWS